MISDLLILLFKFTITNQKSKYRSIIIILNKKVDDKKYKGGHDEIKKQEIQAKSYG